LPSAIARTGPQDLQEHVSERIGDKRQVFLRTFLGMHFIKRRSKDTKFSCKGTSHGGAWPSQPPTTDGAAVLRYKVGYYIVTRCYPKPSRLLDGRGQLYRLPRDSIEYFVVPLAPDRPPDHHYHVVKALSAILVHALVTR
jgi:hypothetical protein